MLSSYRVEKLPKDHSPTEYDGQPIGFVATLLVVLFGPAHRLCGALAFLNSAAHSRP